MLCYIAYPTSLTLQSANALQTYTTLRELRARRPDMLAFIPRWAWEPSCFSAVGATHLPRPAIGKLSRLYRSTLLYYLEHTAFAWMCAAALLGKRRMIEAVYVRQVVCAAWWSAVIGPCLGIPVIYEAHDLESHNPSRAKERWAQGLLHLLDRAALTRSSAVVSLTADFAHYLEATGWRQAAEVLVIPDAYDDQLFAPQSRLDCRAKLGLAAEAELVVYAGMTFAHRWLDGLLAAVVRLQESHPRLQVLLVGGRPAERAVLRQQAAELGLCVVEHTTQAPIQAQPVQPAPVILAGTHPQAAVACYLGAADVLVIPDTITDITASPLKLFEYLAVGQPLVLPDLPALREIVPGALAHYFPRRDVAGLSQALVAALQSCPDPPGTAARQRLAQDHTYGRRAERILAAVEHVVAAQS